MVLVTDTTNRDCDMCDHCGVINGKPCRYCSSDTETDAQLRDLLKLSQDSERRLVEEVRELKENRDTWKTSAQVRLKQAQGKSLEAETLEAENKRLNERINALDVQLRDADEEVKRLGKLINQWEAGAVRDGQEIKRLREALEPFAKALHWITDETFASDFTTWSPNLSGPDLLRARLVLKDGGR